MERGIIPSLIIAIIGGVVGYIIRIVYAKYKLVTSETKAKEIVDRAKEEAQKLLRKSEAESKEKLLEAKEAILKERREFDKEIKEKRAELSSYERRLIHREENLERRIVNLEEKEKNLIDKESFIKIKLQEISEKEENIDRELERIANLTKEEARRNLEARVKAEVDEKMLEYYNSKIEEAELNAEKKAKHILVSVMERIASETTKEINITNLTLPDDEMKGRIIGREGRNIRTLENLLGVDIIIDDTPEVVTISGFDPIRREIAKITMSRLVKDGRIHPARIEEVYLKVKEDIEQKIFDEGNNAVYSLGLHNVPIEIIKHLGRLYFRTSYGQNVLYHSIEVARISAAIAAEIGANVEIAKKGGLYHDIGKAIYTEEGNKHVEEGVKLLKSVKENEIVIQCVANHHESSAFLPGELKDYKDKKSEPVEAVIVRIADTISSARPGARFNEGAWEDYIRRVEELEKEAKKFEEVEKAFAIQAGREIRVFLNINTPEENVEKIAKELKKNIQLNKFIKYPGRIKITVIKETRQVEFTD